MAQQLTTKQKCCLQCLQTSKVSFGSILMSYWATVNYLSGLEEFQTMQLNGFAEIHHRFCCCAQKIRFHTKDTEFYIPPEEQQKQNSYYGSLSPIADANFDAFPFEQGKKKKKSIYHYLYCGHFVGDRLSLLCILRNIFLFVIPLLFTAFMLYASFVIAFRILNYGTILDLLFMRGGQDTMATNALYAMAIMRLSNVIPWLMQFVQKTVFGELGGVSDNIRLKDFMHRGGHRRTHALNYIKYALRLVASINFLSHCLYIYVYLNHNFADELNAMFYINLVAMAGIYGSMSDWFYFDKEAELYQLKDVAVVAVIDLVTNWMRIVWGVCVYCVVLIVDCFTLLVPVPILAVYFAFNFCFCQNELGDTKWQCEKWENVFDKRLRKEYVFKMLATRQFIQL